MLAQLHRVEQSLNQVILGKPEQVRLALCCLLAEGHLLLEDLPGMGKTTLAHALANSLGLSYRRVQFTNDLLPGDLIGMNIYDTRSQQFHFQAGPVFSQVLLADEINRASPKTQSALLEAMEEKQVSVDGETRSLPKPFFVIATQNPLFHAGTSALPESQLDRFMFRLSLGFPDKQAEHLLLQRDISSSRLELLTEQLSSEQLKKLQAQVPKITASDALLDYLLSLVHASRHRSDMLPLSPRASKAILRAAKAFALINQREFVSASDVQQVFPYVAEHRLDPSSAAQESRLSQLLLQQTPCPI
ncbi:AAA family ATPase [Rheinheimera aquimaris]|uniref:AAA family ATPase n=1 Tax=Rheinheimera aquimaris TaxID=412437 RepID=UPI000E9C79E9|nr:MoxR family ATPase [Rheinheimera aquimaris]MCD1599388.1 MoxR family ATPase [Rheinheimera aquimaris]HBN87543.1 AAA family ATPase [Rheinheimera sp.]